MDSRQGVSDSFLSLFPLFLQPLALFKTQTHSSMHGRLIPSTPAPSREIPLPLVSECQRGRHEAHGPRLSSRPAGGASPPGVLVSAPPQHRLDGKGTTPLTDGVFLRSRWWDSSTRFVLLPDLLYW